MSVIDPEGLFAGDRLRHCSNLAQLHWPRLFLASDGFARIEINYARIIGRAYATFTPVPTEAELQAWFQEYARNYLLFLYEMDGQLWGQWDTRAELLPRYKTASDRRSPQPPEGAFIEWKRRYRAENKAFPKCFGRIPETFLHGVGVGVGGGEGGGKNICASDNARLTDLSLSVDQPPFETTEPNAVFPLVEKRRAKSNQEKMTSQQEAWFSEWWDAYWLHKAKKATREAFRKNVQTEERFQQVLTATKAQTPAMMAREPQHRPHGATWLNAERWEDEVETATATPALPDVFAQIARELHGKETRR